MAVPLPKFLMRAWENDRKGMKVGEVKSHDFAARAGFHFSQSVSRLMVEKVDRVLGGWTEHSAAGRLRLSGLGRRR